MVDLGIGGIEEAELIASGGSALVYRAIDTTATGATGAGDDDAWVAVKVLRGLRGADVTRRFAREQSAAERLGGHPAIISVHRSGLTGSGEPFLVMPLMRGSLADELDEHGPFGVDRAVADVAAAADAIEYAHDNGVLHRDLKPGNLLRDDNDAIVVSDFGIARVVDAGISSATLGAATPLFAAPELLTDNVATRQTDVYALGAMLYALLAGDAAFSDSENIWATISRIRTEAPATIDGIPAPIMRVITQSMAKSPAERPDSAASFRLALLDALAAGDDPDWRPPAPSGIDMAAPNETASGRSIGNPVDAAPPEDEPAAPTPPPPAATGERSRTGMRLLASVGALILIVGLGALAVTQLFDDERPEVATGGDRQGPVDSSLPSPTSVVTGGTDTEATEVDEVEGSTENSTSADADPQSGDTGPDGASDGDDAGNVPPPAERFVRYEGNNFSALFPEGWSVARSDVDVGYGFRSDFVSGDQYLTIDTTPSDRRTSDISIAQSAQEIAASLSSASAVTSETRDGLTMHSFTFTNRRGVPSIDLFFEVDGDGYAIVAGSPTDPEAAFEIARRVALTIRSAA